MPCFIMMRGSQLHGNSNQIKRQERDNEILLEVHRDNAFVPNRRTHRRNKMSQVINNRVENRALLITILDTKDGVKLVPLQEAGGYISNS